MDALRSEPMYNDLCTFVDSSCAHFSKFHSVAILCSCFTIFKLYFFHVALFSCCIFFHAALVSCGFLFFVAILPCSALFMIHFVCHFSCFLPAALFYVALFSFCAFFMLHYFHDALFSCFPFPMLHQASKF